MFSTLFFQFALIIEKSFSLRIQDLFLRPEIAFFVSLYLLYKFNDYGRQLFIVTNIIGILFVFSDGYVVFDSFDYFLDSISSALVGFTIAISYFSNLSKEFKKKK